ncbi:MAG: type II methionyl aminopeptidase [Candidatus Micrarchaeota archaeon]|nr:type II methionyl aminopeptidase [Candidatus Micrarchaeota archaeon]
MQNYKKAGEVVAKVRKHLKNLVNPGETLLDIAETIEKMIKDEKAEPAFPVNLSINQIAAHYTPTVEEQTTIKEEDIVKIDFGVHIDGCIIDNAITIDLSGKNEKLLLAAKDALDVAVQTIKAGVGDGTVGKKIEEKIKEYGFRPIKNLTGHLIEKYNLHTGIDIPNYAKEDSYYFKEGDIVAIEPFATDGEGRVIETPNVEIYSIVGGGKLRMRSSRELFGKLLLKYKGLPFARRWLGGMLKTNLLISASLRELVQEGCLHPYYVLKEAGNGLVSQFEHTLLVKEDGVEILDGEFTF